MFKELLEFKVTNSYDFGWAKTLICISFLLLFYSFWKGNHI